MRQAKPSQGIRIITDAFAVGDPLRILSLYALPVITAALKHSDRRHKEMTNNWGPRQRDMHQPATKYCTLNQRLSSSQQARTSYPAAAARERNWATVYL